MILGLSSKAGAGKDLSASLIKELYPSYNFETRKFAGKLKQIVGILTGKSVEELELPEVKNSQLSPEWGMLIGGKIEIPTYRQVLQWVGTEAMRDVLHTNVWCNALFADYKGNCKKGNCECNCYPNWLISDVRFPNESNAIKERGGLLIRLERPNLILMDHPSETSLDDYNGFDAVIENNGTIEDLKNKLQKFLDPKLPSYSVAPTPYRPPLQFRQ